MAENRRVVLFDLDGTLIDSVPMILASFRFTLTQHLGHTVPDEVLIRGIGTPLRTQLAQYTHDEMVIEAMFDTYKAHNMAHHETGLRRFPAMSEVIETLFAAGVPLGVVTSKARGAARLGLETCGLAHAFEVLVAMEDCVRHKPDPEPVRVGLERMGAQAEGSFYVGDATHDLNAGRAAGVRTVAVGWGLSPREELLACGPDHFLDHPSEMLAVFETLRNPVEPER